MIVSAQRGDETGVVEAYDRLTQSGVPSEQEKRTRAVSDAFLHYARGGDVSTPVRLAWWPRPFPGNFGDWLSPLVVGGVAQRPLSYVSPTARSNAPHLVAVGSIGRFVKPDSIVVGTGISATSIELDTSARYVSVRGPITARLLAECGGPRVESFGDPGALLSRLIPVQRPESNGRLALVRHFAHSHAPLRLSDDVDEISVLMSHPDDVASFVEKLHEYDGIVTSAMHVMIACHSYGLPCALVGFEGFESAVHGSGIKYEDYARGVGVESGFTPAIVPMDVSAAGLRDLLVVERIADSKLDEIESAVVRALDELALPG
jgi:hypothetical protein